MCIMYKISVTSANKFIIHNFIFKLPVLCRETCCILRFGQIPVSYIAISGNILWQSLPIYINHSVRCKYEVRTFVFERDGN